MNRLALELSVTNGKVQKECTHTHDLLPLAPLCDQKSSWLLTSQQEAVAVQMIISPGKHY